MEGKSLQASRAEIVAGVSPAWQLDGLDAALSKISAEGVTPPPALILEALRYGEPSDVIAVILAQDPYYTPQAATGLCFSTRPEAPLQPSLARIFGCLDRAGLRGADGRTSGDLRAWAVQGVLMLNVALTTRVGTAKVHTSKWKPFTDALLGWLATSAAADGRVLHFMLWGGDARVYAPLARLHGHAVHEYSHPSPVGDNKQPVERRFRMCPHFEEVNAALAAAGRRPICWDNAAPVMAFCDGACSNNGYSGAKASFASVILGGQFGRAVLRGSVAPFEYAFVSEADPALGIRPTAVPIAPSNNRGELLGAIYVMLMLLRGAAAGPIEIVTDSTYTIKTLLKHENARCNLDLLRIGWRLLFGELPAARASYPPVRFTHTRSHQPQPPPGAPARERLLWAGNHRADGQAAAALERAELAELVSGPAVLRQLARSGQVQN